MIDYIVDSANALVERYKTRDPYEIADRLGIYVNRFPLGKVKGFYKVMNRERHIVLNDALEEWEKNIVMAHELGHDQLHRSLTAITMSDNCLLHPIGKTERDANLFAAELLLEDALIKYMHLNLTIGELSHLLHTQKELLEYKLFILKEKYPLFTFCIELRYDFLRS